MKESVLEVLTEEPCGVLRLLQRTGLTTRTLGKMLDELEGLGLVACRHRELENGISEKRKVWAVTELGVKTVKEWGVVTSLLNEPPILRTVLVAW